jgi:hypothetical protein
VRFARLSVDARNWERIGTGRSQSQRKVRGIFILSIHPDPDNDIQNATERPPPPAEPASPAPGFALRTEAMDADFEAGFDALHASDCGAWDGPPFLDLAFWGSSSSEDSPPAPPPDAYDASSVKRPTLERKSARRSWLREAMGSWVRVASGKQG